MAYPDWDKKFILTTDASLEDRPFDLITDHKALLAFKKITNTNPRLERWSIKLSRFTYNILQNLRKPMVYRKKRQNI
jgi:hypothetical protein